MNKCLTCGKECKRIYCNSECYYKSPKLKEQAKNSYLIKLNKEKKWHKGICHNKETKKKISKAIINEWKKENTTLKKPPIYEGEQNYKWKGEEAGYRAKHNWIERQLSKADKCEICGLNNIPEGMDRYFDWANISDEYNRDKDDWVMLCRKCHKKFDMLKKRNLYVVQGVECKSNGNLSKIEKEKCNWLLQNKIFSKILIAYNENGVKFKEYINISH